MSKAATGATQAAAEAAFKAALAECSAAVGTAKRPAAGACDSSMICGLAYLDNGAAVDTLNWGSAAGVPDSCPAGGTFISGGGRVRFNSSTASKTQCKWNGGPQNAASGGYCEVKLTGLTVFAEHVALDGTRDGTYDVLASVMWTGASCPQPTVTNSVDRNLTAGGCTASGPNRTVSVCADAGAGAQCGTVNGTRVCVSDAPGDGECKVLGSGLSLCVVPGLGSRPDSPPAPNNGTPGVAQKPDAVLSSADATGEPNGTKTVEVTTADSAKNSTVATNGTGGGGGGGSDFEGDEADDSLSGGATCGSPPSCSGSPIQCYQALEAWKLQCQLLPGDDDDLEAALSQGETAGGRPGSLGEETLNFAELLELPLPSSCTVEDMTFTVMGQSVVLPLASYCWFFEMIGAFVLIAAAFTSFRIITA